MITYQVEDIYAIREEVEPLIPIHYDETEAATTDLKPSVDWNRYKAMTEMGMCRTMTARDDGVLVGYFCTIVVPHIHYDCVIAINDAVFVHPAWRGKTSYWLFTNAINDLRKHTEADTIQVRMKIRLPFRKLLAKLGFQQTEESWELTI